MFHTTMYSFEKVYTIELYLHSEFMKSVEIPVVNQ